MIKVAVKNFQSIASADLEIDGFTVVTGKNNSGKSALLRAVNSLFTNALGSSFVRNGEDYCQVTLGFDDGSTVSWKKGDKIKPTYWINGGEPIHCGRNAPTELEQFGVLPLKVGGREIWPQIAPQFTGQVFLIDMPGSVMAEMVADVDRVSELNKALKNCESDKRSNRSRLKIRNEDYHLLKTERANYDTLSDREEHLARLQNERNELSFLRGKIERLNSLRERYREFSEKVFSLSNIHQQLSLSNSLVSEQIRIEETANTVRNYSTLERKYNKYDREVRKLEGVSDLSIPPTDPIKDVRAKIKPLKPLLDRRKKAEVVILTYEKLKGLGIPDTDKVVEVMRRLKTLKELRGKRDTLLSNIAKLENLPTNDFNTPNFSRLRDLVKTRDYLHNAQNSVYTTESIIETTQSELQEIEKHISKTLSDHGECPLCGEDV